MVAMAVNANQKMLLGFQEKKLWSVLGLGEMAVMGFLRDRSPCVCNSKLTVVEAKQRQAKINEKVVLSDICERHACERHPSQSFCAWSHPTPCPKPHFPVPQS